MKGISRESASSLLAETRVESKLPGDSKPPSQQTSPMIHKDGFEKTSARQGQTVEPPPQPEQKGFFGRLWGAINPFAGTSPSSLREESAQDLPRAQAPASQPTNKQAELSRVRRLLLEDLKLPPDASEADLLADVKEYKSFRASLPPASMENTRLRMNLARYEEAHPEFRKEAQNFPKLEELGSRRTLAERELMRPRDILLEHLNLPPDASEADLLAAAQKYWTSVNRGRRHLDPMIFADLLRYGEEHPEFKDSVLGSKK